MVLTSASVLPGYGIYGAHAPPYRLNTYDESEAGDNWDWHFIDSMYFTMATLTTVGFGDVTPVTGTGRFVVGLEMIAAVTVIPFEIAGVSRELAQADAAAGGTSAPVCTRCGLAGHDDDARFCKRCGLQLRR